jgi:Rrf2 family iron-sulfur cluster assembly transcriptional regulator
VSEIVKAVDEPMIATGCFSDKSRCLTHELWEELGNQIHRYLSSVSLADVISKRVLGSSGVLDGPFAQPRAQPQPQTAPLPVMEPAE